MVIYETINLINGKRYIGKDSKNDPEYLGSNTHLKRAIKKYGIQSFRKGILEYCNSEEELNTAEIKWIKWSDAQKSKIYYNIAPGGFGGDNFTYNPNKEKIRAEMLVLNNINKMHGKKQTAKTKQLQKEKAKGRYTLEWFIQKNGIELGTQLYDERNTMLKNRKMRGEDNPAFRYVNLEELDNFVRNTDISHRQIAIHFGVGNTALLSKFKKLYNDNNLKRIRTNLNSN